MLRGIAAVALGAAALGAEAQSLAKHVNLTTGGPLRPGVYGRVALRGAEAPPVIYPQPIVASGEKPQGAADPVYLYVPPGQVRKWGQHCAKWKACDEPVLFVRMDDSPSRWGSWRSLREQQVALFGVIPTKGGSQGFRLDTLESPRVAQARE